MYKTIKINDKLDAYYYKDKFYDFVVQLCYHRDNPIEQEYVRKQFLSEIDKQLINYNLINK